MKNIIIKMKPIMKKIILFVTWIIIAVAILLLIIIIRINLEKVVLKYPIIIKYGSYVSGLIPFFTSVGGCFLFFFTYSQFKKFNKEYKIRNQPKVIPYIDVVKDGNGSIVLLKFNNASDIVAKNIKITFDEEWLNSLSKLGESEEKSANIFRKLGTYKNFYITNKQDPLFIIGLLDSCLKISSIPIIITITYSDEKRKPETFTMAISNIENISQDIILENSKIFELHRIANNLEKLTL
jgi:uncharacterized integral membrane protein